MTGRLSVSDNGPSPRHIRSYLTPPAWSETQRRLAGQGVGHLTRRWFATRGHFLRVVAGGVGGLWHSASSWGSCWGTRGCRRPCRTPRCSTTLSGPRGADGCGPTPSAAWRTRGWGSGRCEPVRRASCRRSRPARALGGAAGGGRRRPRRVVGAEVAGDGVWSGDGTPPPRGLW